MTQLVLLVLVLSSTTGLAVQQSKSSPDPKRRIDSKKESGPNAKSKADNSKEEKKSAEIETFITYAQSVPAEFSADLLIRIAESGEIKQRKRRQELLVEAFYTAAKAQQPVKLAPLPGSAVDSRLGYQAQAFRLGLDSLSLQCRAIRALIPLNKQKARQLFDEIKLKLDRLDCENSLAYDLDSFFDTIQVIAQTGFSTEETQRGEHIYFVENYVSNINSSNQIRPAIKILISLKTTDLELARLGRTFSTALAKIATDDRAFSAPWNSTMNSLDDLVSKFKNRGLPGDEIIESYRTYLINQLTAQRCIESVTAKEQKILEAGLVTHFNDKLRSLAYKNISPISEDEIKPGRREGSVRDDVYWKSAKSKTILSAMRRLRFKSAGNEFNAQEKESPEWQSQLSELMRALANWEPSDEKSEEDYFHQKCVIYDALINSIPADKQYDGLRDELLRDFTSTLSGSQLQKAKPAEWFLHAKILIDRTNAATPREREKLVPLIYNSRSTILHLYIQKEELLKPAKTEVTSTNE
ncbi:MAG TPA: hypothetical protein VKB05_02810 [Pyrinomonadaceae bacterium]|nr:hypothetical protein [Pyrinomonadaceae bacterium]